MHDLQHTANLYLDGLTCRACLLTFGTKSNLKRHLMSSKRCLAICRMVYPHGLISIEEVARGLELHRLTDLDPVRAHGPSISSPLAFIEHEGSDLPEPPEGFVGPGHASDTQRLARVKAAPAAVAPVSSDIANLFVQRPSFGAERAFLIAFGGRRRPGDIVHCLE